MYLFQSCILHDISNEFVNENGSVINVQKHLDIYSDSKNTYLRIQGKDHLNVLIFQKVSLVQAIYKDTNKFIQKGNFYIFSLKYSDICVGTSMYKSHRK